MIYQRPCWLALPCVLCKHPDWWINCRKHGKDGWYTVRRCSKCHRFDALWEHWFFFRNNLWWLVASDSQDAVPSSNAAALIYGCVRILCFIRIGLTVSKVPTMIQHLCNESRRDKKKQPAYGADVLRLWVASSDYMRDVLIGPELIADSSLTLRNLRNCARFMLGNLEGFDPQTDLVPYEELPATERYMLHKVHIGIVWSVGSKLCVLANSCLNVCSVLKLCIARAIVHFWRWAISLEWVVVPYSSMNGPESLALD